MNSGTFTSRCSSPTCFTCPTRNFLEAFLSGIEVALERIDPENFAQHEALALLMGRPIAVVRAVVNLELRGQPAINQDWNVFRTDIERDLKRELTHAGRWASQPAERETDAAEEYAFQSVSATTGS